MTSQTFDYIIVGGGTAGVVIASRLKKYLPDSRIALLEAGPNAVDHPTVNNVSGPPAWFELMQEGLIVDYSTVPQPHLANRPIMNCAGRLLSGSSAVNVGHWMRPSRVDCDLLAQRAGSDKFKFDNMIKYFKMIETHHNVGADKDVYGFEGPIGTVGGRKYPLRDMLQKSAEALGYSYNPGAAKSGDNRGLIDFAQNFRATSQTTATRQHSGKVYDLSGVEVICDVTVAKVLFDDAKRATGVELADGATLHARKEIIVSCGTQRTPQLLMLSGIGPAAELEKHDIQLQVDAPAVGQNLMDHNAMIQYFQLKDGSKGYAHPFVGHSLPEYGHGLPIDFNLIGHIPREELSPYLKNDGRDADASPLLDEERCHFMSIMFYDNLFAPPGVYADVIDEGTRIAVAAVHVMPLSRGSVTLKSSNPADAPACDPRFLSTETDRFIMRKAVRENLRLVEAAPLKDEIVGEVPPKGLKALTAASSDAEIDERNGQVATTIFHPMGTCALGTVLDGDFKVKGVEGLRVCDASVFAEPVAGMPSYMIYALAELCAATVAGRL
ncbi:alcohol oxidase [Phaeosphaeriaceae sp. SRC1lsM3a]|nr:alcohol oxidase [Stagonospora sp. SRC1lsM3a]